MTRMRAMIAIASVGAIAWAAWVWMVPEPLGLWNPGERAVSAAQGEAANRDANAARAYDHATGAGTLANRRPAALDRAAAEALVKRYSDRGAQSAEEALWLGRHGYPDDEQAERYARLTDAVLEELASKGDRLAATELASRQLMTGEGKAGADKLLELAADGSIYALERLGLAYSSATPDKRFLSVAYVEAGRRLGDWGAPTIGSESIPRQALNTIEQSLAMQYSQLVIDRLNAVRARRGMTPLRHDARPGAETAFEQTYVAFLTLNELPTWKEKYRSLPSEHLPAP